MSRVLLLLILVCFGKVAFAAEDCSIADTLLRPAKDNLCFLKLTSKAKDADDRRWLLGLMDHWKPPGDLVLQMVPGGFRLYREEKTILQAQWISMSPPTLDWNGRILQSDASVRGSLRKWVGSLLGERKSAWLWLWEEAFAASADVNGADFLTLFLIAGSNTPVDASTLVRDHPEVFPNFSEKSKGGDFSEFHCSSSGVTQYSFPNPLNRNRPLVLTPNGNGIFKISGLAKGDLYLDSRATYSVLQSAPPAGSGGEDVPASGFFIGLASLCEDDTLGATTLKAFCNKVWEEYKHKDDAKDPSMRTMFRWPLTGGNWSKEKDGCENVNVRDPEDCRKFYGSQQVGQFAMAASLPSGTGPQNFLCNDPMCENKKSPTNSGGDCPAPQKGVSCEKNLAKFLYGKSKAPSGFDKLRSVLNESVFASRVLSACCQEEGCRALAATSKINTRIIDEPGTR